MPSSPPTVITQFTFRNLKSNKVSGTSASSALMATSIPLASEGVGRSRFVDSDGLPYVGSVVGAIAGNGEGYGFIDGTGIH
jgi:hypothetical protein